MGVAKMDNWSAGEVGGVFAGVVAALAAVGKGLAWLLNWRDERISYREKRLDALERSLQAREKQYREAIEHELADLRGEMVRLRSQQGALSFSLLEVAIAHRDADPDSPALSRAAASLRQAFPPEYDTPAEIMELIRALEFRDSQERQSRR